MQHSADPTPVHTAIYELISSAQNTIDAAEDDINAAHRVLDLLPTEYEPDKDTPPQTVQDATVATLRHIIDQAESTAQTHMDNAVHTAKVLQLLKETQTNNAQAHQNAQEIIERLSQMTRSNAHTANINAINTRKVLQAITMLKYPPQQSGSPIAQDQDNASDSGADNTQATGPDPVKNPEEDDSQAGLANKHQDEQPTPETPGENTGSEYTGPDSGHPTPDPDPPQNSADSNHPSQQTEQEDMDSRQESPNHGQPQDKTPTSLVYRLPGTLAAMTLQQAATLHTDPKQAIQLFQEAIPQPMQCPYCASTSTRRRIESNPQIIKQDQHACSDCHKSFTIKTNTRMHGSNIPLGKWAYAVYLAATNPNEFSPEYLMERLTITPTTARKVHGHITESFREEGNPLANLSRNNPPQNKENRENNASQPDPVSQPAETEK